HGLPVAHLPHVRARGVHLHAAALAAAAVAGEHHDRVPPLEVVLRHAHPVLPGAQPRAQAGARRLDVAVDPGAARELRRPAPLEVVGVDRGHVLPVATTPVLVDLVKSAGLGHPGGVSASGGPYTRSVLPLADSAQTAFGILLAVVLVAGYV